MARDRGSKAFVLSVTCLIFFAVGMLSSGIGPSLPGLAQTMSIRLEDVGAIFTALFIGSLISQVSIGPLADKFKHRYLLMGALTLTGLSVLGVVLSGLLIVALVMMFFAGVGLGVLIVSSNVFVSETFAPRSLPALNLLNVFFGVGAVTGPTLASFSIRLWGSALPVLWAASLLMLTLIPAVYILQEKRKQPDPAERDARRSTARTAVPSPYKSPLLWVMGTLLLLYVGIEVGTGGWVTTYMTRTTSFALEDAALAASGFYLALTAGRLFGVALGTRLDASRVMMLGLFGALAAGILFALSTGNAPLTIASVLLFGFCLGPVYPTTIAIVTTAFPLTPGRVVGVVTALGSLGGSAMPWLEGILLESVSPQAVALYTAAVAVALVITFTVATRLPPPKQSVQPSAITAGE